LRRVTTRGKLLQTATLPGYLPMTLSTLHRWGIMLIGMALLCHGALSRGAEPKAAPRYIVDILGDSASQPQKKLPSRVVIAVIQTRDGYLWLGTLNGLVRFDGDKFTTFSESNTPGLGNNLVVYLFEDSRGWLWVGTGDGGVSLIRAGRVDSLPIQRGNGGARLMSACEDDSGAVWLYLADGQLWRYADGQMERSLIGGGYPSLCRSVIAESNGPVWAGTDWEQIGVGGPTNVTTPRVMAGKLDFLLASRGGGYWRLADNRIEKWLTNKMERSYGFYPWANAANVRVTSACEDLEGNLVVGVLNDGVYWFDGQANAEHLFPENGLSHAGVLSVCVDREGSLWVGTDGGGLNRVKPRVGALISGSRSVQSACEDGQGGIWVGFADSGVMHTKDGVERTYGWEDGLSPNTLSVFADKSGQLWVGTRAPAGLSRFQDGRFTVVPETDGLEVYAIFQSRLGALWLGTPVGLIRRDGQSWRMFSERDGLSEGAVKAIAEDSAGNLCVGTAGGGLNWLEDGKITAIRKGPEALPGDNVTSLLIDRDGVLWVGTGSGLARFKNGRWSQFTTANGLTSDSITYLVEDTQGFLWAGSNLGLMRLQKNSLDDVAEGRSKLIACRSYDETDGLPSAECTSGSQPAAIRTKSGQLWFPTIRGLVGIDPTELKRNTNPPPVIIESVLVDGCRQLTNGIRAPLPDEIVVPAEAERLEFHFTSLNLAAPERALFRYQLEGHESSLSEPGASREARFSNLPPGEFRFHVMAANEDGLWNEAGCAIRVIVLPPFWRTWWFISSSTLALLGVVVGTVYWFSTQKFKRQLALMRQKEALERERSRIARDLHDQLGANLTRVSLLGELVESDKDEPVEVEAHARQISKTAAETANALDEIVWAANPSNDTMEGLVNYLCKYAHEFLTTAGMSCRLDVPAQVPPTPIAPDARHSIFLVAKEALNNVAKHAGASNVRFQIKVDPGRFMVEIEDDGRGPGGAATAANRGRNGLRNMRRRMEDVGGTFSIKPASKHGTVVRLTAPLDGN